MGKDDKQRRKGNSQGASSSRAAELLQKSGVNISFLGFNAADSALNFGDTEEQDEYEDLGAKVRVIFRKFGKREANTREKALRSLGEMITEDPDTSNCFKAFSGVYSKLIFDSSTAVRIACNETLAIFIKTFKGKIASELVTILPLLLLSTFDHITAVKKSAFDLLEECFEPDKREKIYLQFTSKAVEVSLEVIKRRHNSLGPQKFEDLENYSQRCERLINQALSCVDGFLPKYDDKKAIFKTLESEFDKLNGMGPPIQGKLIKVLLVYMKLESFEDLLKSKACGKIVKLMDSPNESVSQHAFSCYLYMANAVGNGKSSNFSLKDFVCVPVLRMVSRKEAHYKSLEHCLLPLVIIVIKEMEDEKELKDWIKDLLSAFFEGDMPTSIFLSWAKAFVDVIEILNLKYLEKVYDDDIAEAVEDSVVRFIQIFLSKEEQDLKENEIAIENLALKLVIRQCSEKGEKKVDDFTNLALNQIFYRLPKSEDFILKIWEHRDDTSLELLMYWLERQVIERNLVSDGLYIRVLSSGCYKQWDDLDFKAVKEIIVDRMKSMKELNDVLFDGFRYLVENRKAEGKELFRVVDLNKMKHAVKLLLLTSDGASTLLEKEDREMILSVILNGLVENSAIFNIDGFKAALLCWLNTTKGDKIYSAIRDTAPRFNVKSLTKLISVLHQVEGVPSSLLVELSNVFVELVVDSSFEDFPDESDKETLDWFLSQHQDHLHVVQSVLSTECSLKEIAGFYGRIARGFDGISTILNLFEPTESDNLNLSKSLDQSLSGHILAKEPLGHAFAFTVESDHFPKNNMEALVQNALVKATIYMNLKPEHVTHNMKLHLILLYAASVVHQDFIYKDELTQALRSYLNNFEDFFKNWDDESKKSVIKVAATTYHGKHFSFTFMYGLRRLKANWMDLCNAMSSLALNDNQRLGLQAMLDNDFIFDAPELIAKREYFPFIVSLERQTFKLKQNIRDEDVAIVLLAELKEKVEKSDSDWLFTSTGDLDKDLLSCAVLRMAIQLVGRLPDLPQELRDFVLCGLITTMQDFSSKDRRSQLSEVMASLALEFFTSYDRKLEDKLSELKSLPELSEEFLENKLLVDSQLQEWREFFGSSASSYAFSWFCWISVQDKDKKVNYNMFSPFLRLQICKTIRNTFLDLKMSEFILNPSAMLTQHIKDCDILSTDDIFDSLVSLLFSFVPELQLLTVFLLQSLVFTHFTVKDEIDDQLKKMLLTSESLPTQDEDETSTERDTIEYKLSRFFDNLTKSLDSASNSRNIDPNLLIWDLLIRTVKLLDNHQSAEFCAQLNSKAIEKVFEMVTRHLPMGKTAEEVRNLIGNRPDYVFSFWKTSFVVDDDTRMLDEGTYALWLYYHSLETLPALVREWVGLWKNEPLRRFTASTLSPVLIEEELKKVGNVKTKSGFSVRSRAATKEIVARYQVEDITLETTIKLPNDYPLSQVTIVHDKRNIIAKGMTHRLHLNLFSYVNTRNGAISDAVLQWKKNVEKQIAGAEDCSICMMTVSSRNYRMPDLKCRQCFKKFHSDCMLKWIQTSAKPTCPLCRNEFY